MKYIGQHIFDYVASFRQNVGVGTDTPGEKLTVAGNIEISVASTGAKGLIFNENGTQTMGIKYQGGQSGNPIDIFRYQDNTTKVRFLENGNVGIGLTSPTEKLHVNGNAIITGGDSVAPQLKLLHDGTNPSTNEELGVVQFQVDYNGSHEDWGKIRLDTNASAFRTNMEFYVKSASGSEQVALTLQGQASAVPNAAFAGDVTIPGNLTVSGTTTTIDTTNLNVEDKNITLNYSTGDSSSTADGAGITIQDAVDSSNDATFLWDATNDKFSFSHGVILSGNITIPNNGTIFCNGTGELRIGNTNSGTVKIGGDGTSTTLTPHSNNLIIRTTRDTDDIIFQAGASVSEFFRLDADTGFTRFADSKTLQLGSSTGSGDLQLVHDGTNSYIKNHVGNLYIYNHTDDGDTIFQGDDGSGGLATYITIDGSTNRVNFNKPIKMADSTHINVGSGLDLQIVHDGFDSYVNNFTGNLNIVNRADDKDIIFQSDDGSGGVETYFFLDGSASSGNPITIFPDNSYLQFGNGMDLGIAHDVSNSNFTNVTGNLNFINYADDKDIVFQSDDGTGGVETYFFLDGSESVVTFPDDKRLTFGTGRDLFLYHTGTDMVMKNFTGDMTIRNEANDKDIIFQSDDGSGGTTAYITIDGSETRTVIAKAMRFNDNTSLQIGGGADFSIHHDGGNTLVQNITGHLYFYQKTDDSDISFFCDDGSGGNTEYFRVDGGTEK